jgi:putative ABC transport system substrate-binding protein
VKRRHFIGGAGASAVLGRRGAWGQQKQLPVIGYLSSAARDRDAGRLRAFHGGLSETGYVEDRNVVIEYRWAEEKIDQLPALAADLARRQVTVIVANNPAALPAKAATKSIPIVFTIGFDPVAAGLVASLNRPGGNLTGGTSLNLQLGLKRVELMHELIPSATMLAFLLNPSSPSAEAQMRDVQAAVLTLGVQLHVVEVNAAGDFEGVLARLAELRAGGLIIGPDALFNSRSEQLAALAVRFALPAIFQFREFAAAGGLMSYGGNLADLYRQSGVYTGRILKGEKPADLPVQQVTKVELIINLKTVRALGITVPPSLLARADEVIE